MKPPNITEMIVVIIQLCNDTDEGKFRRVMTNKRSRLQEAVRQKLRSY